MTTGITDIEWLDAAVCEQAEIITTLRSQLAAANAEVATLRAEQEWRPIETAPCNDTNALVHFKDGQMIVQDLDHDSDPQWWAERGATHWLPLPQPPATEEK